jgi:hypothetical protein
MSKNNVVEIVCERKGDNNNGWMPNANALDLKLRTVARLVQYRTSGRYRSTVLMSLEARCGWNTTTTPTAQNWYLVLVSGTPSIIQHKSPMSTEVLVLSSLDKDHVFTYWYHGVMKKRLLETVKCTCTCIPVKRYVVQVPGTCN